MVNKNSRIFITGHKGLVGSSILQLLINHGFNYIFTVDKNEVNLLNERKVFNFSIIYLFLIYLVISVDKILTSVI